MQLPADVRAALVEALGAYVASAPVQDLPKNLRRLKGFRPRAQARHGDELLQLLDDEIQRKLILQALDDQAVRLHKRVEDVTRTALDRTEGWERRLADLSDVSAEARAGPDGSLERELERERAKVKHARAEARKTKAAARANLEKQQRRIEELERDLAMIHSELQQARADFEAALEEAERERAALVRSARRAEREAEKARNSGEELRTEAKSLRKEAARLKRELTAARAVDKPPARLNKAVVQPEEPAVRTPLGVPKGLYAESPETLDLWLKHPQVSLLVDGYNVSKTEGGFGGLSLEHQRNRLVDEVDRLARTRRVPATIVFDGARIEPASVRRRRRTVVVAYSLPPEVADDHLVALLDEHPNHPVIVVTNDRELQSRSVALGATIARAEQLLALLR
ncbi:MAG: NYN domain-containing protein [Actinomycetota bacterium]